MSITSTPKNPRVTVQLSKIESSPILGIAGSGAIAWLAQQGVTIPETILAASSIEGDGWIVRSGTNEVFVQSSATSALLNDLRTKLEQSPKSVFEIPREDATISLSGAGALLIFAQTCGIDFRKVELKRVIYTRVAGVGCCILPETDQPPHRFRIWFDPSFEDYLWHQLNGIAEDLNNH